MLTRHVAWSHEGVLVAHTVEEALELATEQPGDLMVAGGGEVYAALLPYATHQVLTEVDLEPEGDVHYPQFPAEEWRETARESCDGYDRVWLERMDVAA